MDNGIGTFWEKWAIPIIIATIAAVIAGVILLYATDAKAAIGGAIQGIGTLIAASARGAYIWFTADIKLPRHHFWGWVLLTAFVSFVLTTWLSVRTERSVHHVAASRAPGVGSFDSATLTEEDALILRFVASADGDIVTPMTLCNQFGWARLVTKKYILRLLECGLLEPRSTQGFSSMYPTEGVVLTEDGVNLAIDQGWIPTRPRGNPT
jgi:hypothetical protein